MWAAAAMRRAGDEPIRCWPPGCPGEARDARKFGVRGSVHRDRVVSGVVDGDR
jgi:hypothetical protein